MVRRHWANYEAKSESVYGASADLDFPLLQLHLRRHHPALAKPAAKHEPKRSVFLPAKTQQSEVSASPLSTVTSAAAPCPRRHPRKEPVVHPHAVGYPYHFSLCELPLPDREDKPSLAPFRLTTTGGTREPPKKNPSTACLCREPRIAYGPHVPSSARLRCSH
ncbi:hypothetical protein SCP_0705610 [Sparassis crispa]|uniref:Uncharacterized protein n=1 Tax=Sparassis crispa TaxID=139825 RepID=A0A401GUG7_9APHY|nr:hypothetical protein SCP_0705610 [Sparassis crispa]GBE85374.1 hypothetical protein SCP_0705610 [Sparassis crispa]